MAERLAVVERENDVLREQVRRLQSLLGVTFPAPIELGLTASEARIFGVLMSRDVATKDALMAALYSDQGATEADPKIVDVLVCKIRPKAKRHGIEIKTLWGTGYALPKASKDRVDALLQGEAA